MNAGLTNDEFRRLINNGRRCMTIRRIFQMDTWRGHIS